MQNRPDEPTNDAINAAPFIGIDFGTYKCVITRFDPATRKAEVILNAEGEMETLSFVYYGEDGILVGTPALHMLENNEECHKVIASVKLHLADSIRYPVPGEPTPVEVVTHIFRKLKRDAEVYGGFTGKITRAVVTYPVVFTQQEQDMLRKAAQDAGFHKVHLLAEPEAASIAFIRQKTDYQAGNGILVYDLGAGTLDLALLVRDAQTGYYHAAPLSDGLLCGGDTFDLLFYDHCDTLFFAQHGRSLSGTDGRDLKFLNECRKRKENLSKQSRNTFSWAVPDTEQGLIYFEHTLDIATFESWIHEVVEKTMTRTLAFVTRVRAEHYPVDTVLLIGGSSQIPLVQRSLQETLSIDPQIWTQGHRAVALGAVYYAHDLWGNKHQIEQYRQALEVAQKEAVWNEQTYTHLTDLRLTLDLTDVQAERTERGVLGNTVNEVMGKDQQSPEDKIFQLILDSYPAMLQEAAQRTFTILLVGRSGVGKSSSINSLMDQEVAPVGHHEPTTVTVESYTNEAYGIKFTVVDTPGLCDRAAEVGNDKKYLDLIRTDVPKIDCLLFVTKLTERRVSADESRAIKLISEGCGEGIWKHAVIVFTHANHVYYDKKLSHLEQYVEAQKVLERHIRAEITLWAGSAIAGKVPSVAIDNLERTTPDGNEWLGKLYLAVIKQISDNGLLPIWLATRQRIDNPSQKSDNTNNDNFTHHIHLDDSEPLTDRLLKSVISYVAEVSHVVVEIGHAVYEKAKSFVKNLFK